MAKKKPEIDPEKLSEFYAETDQKKERTEFTAAEPVPLAYVCPRCGKKISQRKEPCPHCGYRGYVPMSEKETLKIRLILFVVLLIVAVAVYLLTRNN